MRITRTRPGRGPVPRLAAMVAATAAAGLLTAAPAVAHTALTAADPAKGSTVPSPARIKLTFTEPVRFPGIVLLDAGGHHHESGKARAAGATVTEQVAGVLPAGVYTVGWRVVAEDGHPVTGDYRFKVAGGAVPSPAPAGASPAAGSPVSGAATPSSTPVARRTTDASGASWWWVGLGAVIVAAAAGGAGLFRRRRART
jgi:copper resistance protein C